MTNKKKNKVMRELPKPHMDIKTIVGKKKTKTVYSPNSFYVKIFTWFLGSVFLGVTVYILLFSSFLAIETIDIAGAENLAKKEVYETIASNMEGKAAGLFRRDNLLVASARAMEEQLADKDKIIKSVEIVKVFPNKLVVKLQERKSMLVYCAGGNCFVIDENGNAYAPADFETGKLGERNLIILTDDGGKAVDPENFFMDLSFIQFVADVKEQLELEDIQFKKDFATPILVSGDLRVETQDGWKIYFNKQLGAQAGAEMLRAVLKNNITEDQIRDLEYIDVRLADKVFYKLRTNGQENTGDGSQPPVEATKNDAVKKEETKKKN